MSGLQFRVLCREFLFRMVDREVLAAHAHGDAMKLLGRLASVLVIISIPFAGMALTTEDAHLDHAKILMAAWSIEHALIATTMLVVGLFAVLSWDAIFPDRRDVLVLAPLPVRATTIFLAKAASLAVALGTAVLTFNAAPGLALPLVLAPPSSSLFDMLFSLGIYRALVAYWITVTACGGFVFCCVLIVQGASAQLPRRIFLRLSAFLQMAAFCLFVGVYFLQPSLASLKLLTAAENRQLLRWLPTYWFLGLLQQLNGSSDGPARSTLETLANRAWIGLAVAVLGVAVTFLLAYVRTLRKIVEEPDIVPRFDRLAWLPGFGKSVNTAVVHFSIRSLLRSRPHRVIFSFYVGIGFAILILFLKTPVARKLSASWTADLAGSFLLLALWTLGIRVVFAMPLELKANWVFRITEIRAAAVYRGACRRALITMSLLPVWVSAAILFSWLWPWRPAAEHLTVLGLLGLAMVDLCLQGFNKIPFTCSYLPGKSNLHITFALCLMGGLNATYLFAEFERRALSDRTRYAWIVVTLTLVAIAAWWRTRAGGRDAGALLFEEELSPVISGLGLHRDGILTVQTSTTSTPRS